MWAIVFALLTGAVGRGMSQTRLESAPAPAGIEGSTGKIVREVAASDFVFSYGRFSL